MKLRTEKAVELHKKKKSKIIFTGGFNTKKDLSEAKFMADHAIELGVLDADIILEEKANNTIGNAFYCKRILEEHGFESATVVTSPHHLRRAKYIFEHIIPGKKLEFKKCKNNLNFFELFQYNFREIRGLSRLKAKGIDLSRV